MIQIEWSDILLHDVQMTAERYLCTVSFDWRKEIKLFAQVNKPWLIAPNWQVNVKIDNCEVTFWPSPRMADTRGIPVSSCSPRNTRG